MTFLEKLRNWVEKERTKPFDVLVMNSAREPIGGGWRRVYAKSREEAIKKCIDELFGKSMIRPSVLITDAKEAEEDKDDDSSLPREMTE